MRILLLKDDEEEDEGSEKALEASQEANDFCPGEDKQEVNRSRDQDVLKVLRILHLVKTLRKVHRN